VMLTGLSPSRERLSFLAVFLPFYLIFVPWFFQLRRLWVVMLPSAQLMRTWTLRSLTIWGTDCSVFQSEGISCLFEYVVKNETLLPLCCDVFF
jgi:hypothetical protein